MYPLTSNYLDPVRRAALNGADLTTMETMQRIGLESFLNRILTQHLHMPLKQETAVAPTKQPALKIAHIQDEISVWIE
jgi:hypothetical protein